MDQGIAVFNRSLECLLRNYTMTRLWAKFLNQPRPKDQYKTPAPLILPEAIRAELKKFHFLCQEEGIPRRVLRLTSTSGVQFFLILKAISYKGEEFYLALFHEHRARFENVRELLQKEKGLTPQEVRVVEAVYQGLSAKEIAYETKLSESTIKSYLKDIFKKLEVHKATELVYYIHQLL